MKFIVKYFKSEHGENFITNTFSKRIRAEIPPASEDQYVPQRC